MSKLAASLSTVTSTNAERVRKGPQGACFGRYPADMDDWAEIERLRTDPTLKKSWREVQVQVDELLGVTTPLHNDKFRYHWRRKCWCWPDELRNA